MPTYLVHGFRWHRPVIRIHVILNDLEDAAPEWLMAPATSTSILGSLYKHYDFLPPSYPPSADAQIPIPSTPHEEGKPPKMERPATATPKPNRSRSMVSLRARSISFGKKNRPPAPPAEAAPPLPHTEEHNNGVNGRKASTISLDPKASLRSGSMRNQSTKAPTFNDWSVVKLLEQYDPNDFKVVSQPYAYVADYMVEVSLGVSITEEMARYETRMKMEDRPMTPTSPETSRRDTPMDDSDTTSLRDARNTSSRTGWLPKLRDGLQAGEDIGWHVVVCGDEERAAPLEDAQELDEASDEGLDPPRSAGFRGLFWKRNR